MSRISTLLGLPCLIKEEAAQHRVKLILVPTTTFPDIDQVFRLVWL